MKKLSLLFSIFILTFTLSSCSIGEVSMNSFSTDNRKIANEQFDKILLAVESQDSMALKGLFSKNAIDSSEKLNDEINNLFDYFQVEVIAYDDWGGPNTETAKNYDGNGHSWQTLRSTYNVETSGGMYQIAILTYVKDTNSNNIGINSLYITKADDTEKGFAYWGDGNWTPGINIE